MGTPLPDLNAGPLPLGQIRDEARRQLVDALDSRRGKKILVLDPKITGFLGLLAEVPLLKEHGVDQLVYLSADPLEGVDVRSILYLARATLQNAQLIAQQVKATNRAGASLEYAAFLAPRRTMLVEEVLEREGVRGDVQLAEWPLDFVPFDSDVLSLELDGALRELAVDGDPTCLYHTARGLSRLQQLHGTIGRVTGRGPAAQAVRELLARMRSELGAEAPRTGAGRIDTLILIDRSTDLVSPMCTQLTYEGLVDETLGIKNGSVTLEPAAAPGQKPQRLALNSADRTFAQLRDLSFRAATLKLGEWAKSAQQGRKDSQRQDVTLTELKDFMVHLRLMPNVSRQAGLADLVRQVIVQHGFTQRVHAEQDLLAGGGADACCELVDDLMLQEEPIAAVLRLLCLVSLTQGGVPKKHFDRLRQEVLRTYGHQHILTLGALQDAGLLRLQQGGRPAFPTLRRALRLFVESVDEVEPSDAAFVHACYAPISVRLVEHALGPPNAPAAAAAVEEALKLLPGGAFDVQQSVDEQGMPIETPFKATAHTEISALRFLSTQPHIHSDFVVATTKLINGTTLLESLSDEAVRRLAAASAPV